MSNSSRQNTKIQMAFNQKIIWMMLKINTILSEESQEIFSKDISELVDIQTELRKYLSSNESVKEEI